MSLSSHSYHHSPQNIDEHADVVMRSAQLSSTSSARQPSRLLPGSRAAVSRSADAPTGGLSFSPQPRQPPIYWQALQETCIFAGPLGEVTGTVDAGCVVREHRRYQDSFGGWWIGVATAAEPTETISLMAIEPAPDVHAKECNTGGAVEIAGARPLVEPTLSWLSYNGSHLVAFEDVGRAAPEWVQVFAEPWNLVGGTQGPSVPTVSRGTAASGKQQLRPNATSIDGNSKSSSHPKSGSANGAKDLQREPHDAEKPIQSVDTAAILTRSQQVVAVEQLEELCDGCVAGVPSEAQLFFDFWEFLSNVHESSRAASSRLASSWNQRYQETLEEVLFHTSGTDTGSLRRAQARLDGLLQDFAAVCQQIAVAVVEHMLRGRRAEGSAESDGGSADALFPHPKFERTVFYSEGLLVRLWCDTPDGYFGGETRAQKYAQRRFQGTKLLAQTAQRSLLCIPLTALVDFEGYRMTICSIPPIQQSSGRVYDKNVLREGETPAFVQQLLMSLAEALNLSACGQSVQPSNRQSWRSGLPVEMVVHAGRDRRLYLLDANRLGLVSSIALGLTDAKAVATALAPQPAVEVTLSTFRPELTLSWPERVNVNTGVSAFCNAADVRQSWAVADYLKTSALTACAGMIGLHVPVSAALRLPENGVSCRACEADISSEEVRFVVCRSPQRCCCICAECFTATIVSANALQKNERGDPTDDDGDAATPLDVKKCAKCWQSTNGARPLNGLLMQATVSELAHACGLPLSCLGYVYHRLPRSSRPFVARYVETEMVARAASQLLRTALRGAATPADACRTVEEFLTPLVQSAGPRAERLWSRELGPLLERMFPGIVEPFSTCGLPKELLLERVGELTGVVLTPTSLASFSRAETSLQRGSEGDKDSQPYIQVQAILPRVRIAKPALPPLDDTRTAVQAAVRDVEGLHSLLESALLFWIGYTPRGIDETLQPKYLDSFVAPVAAP